VNPSALDRAIYGGWGTSVSVSDTGMGGQVTPTRVTQSSGWPFECLALTLEDGHIESGIATPWIAPLEPVTQYALPASPSDAEFGQAVARALDDPTKLKSQVVWMSRRDRPLSEGTGRFSTYAGFQTGILPVRPTWGFLIDWIFWAAVVCLATVAPSWIRSRYRLARGECAACGYSRSGLPLSGTCPECGTQIQVRGSR
jgi:hypothetical protein